MSTTTRESAIGLLLLVTWTLSSFGTAQENWPLVWAAIPSMTLALVLHLAGMLRQTRDASERLRSVKDLQR
jgi:hypothetical protein